MASSRTHDSNRNKDTGSDIIDLTDENDGIETTAPLTQNTNSSPVHSGASAQTPIDLDDDDDEDKDEDEDLRRAIALSMFDQPQTSQHSQKSDSDKTVTNSPTEQQTPGTLTSERAERKTDGFMNTKPTTQAKPSENTSTKLPMTSHIAHSAGNDVKSNAGSFDLSSLGRAQMEAERLARLKRKRDENQEDEMNDTSTASGVGLMTRIGRAISPPALQRKLNNKEDAKGIKTIQFPRNDITAGRSHSKQIDSTKTVSTAVSSTHSVHQEYPNGIVLQTHLDAYPTARSISFADVIAPASELQACVLSSFIWDFDWLFPHFDCNKTYFCLVMQAKTEIERKQIQQEFEGVPNIGVVFPPMEGVASCMHSKLIILFYEKRARIVVPTANLVGFDWGVGSVMENTLWLIDLPINKAANGKPETEFKKSMVAFLKAQKIPEDALKKLNYYDFSRTEHIGFVYSVAGSHTGNDQPWRNIGHCGLGKTITSLGLAASEPVEIDFVTSSVGSLTSEFMRNIYLACQGDDGLTEYTLRSAKSFPARREGPDILDRKVIVQKTVGEQWRNNFRFYFPSQDTVAASNGGPKCAGTICFSKRWWEGDKFPRNNMRDCISIRSGLLMHNKIIFVRLKSPKQVGNSRYTGWTYIGSGNLSESAWGRLFLVRTTKLLKLNCRNWECGVVVPAQEQQSSISTHQHDLSVFTETIPVPIKSIPEDRYSSGKNQPWFFGS